LVRSGLADEKKSLTIDVVNLSRPKEKQHKEVTTTEKGDKKDDNHSLLGLVEYCSWYHRVWCVEFPDEESDNEDKTDDQWCEVMRAAPGVL
jgi:hypothetical protein